MTKQKMEEAFFFFGSRCNVCGSRVGTECEAQFVF